MSSAILCVAREWLGSSHLEFLRGCSQIVVGTGVSGMVSSLVCLWAVETDRARDSSYITLATWSQVVSDMAAHGSRGIPCEQQKLPFQTLSYKHMG